MRKSNEIVKIIQEEFDALKEEVKTNDFLTVWENLEDYAKAKQIGQEVLDCFDGLCDHDADADFPTEVLDGIKRFKNLGVKNTLILVAKHEDYTPDGEDGLLGAYCDAVTKWTDKDVKILLG